MHHTCIFWDALGTISCACRWLRYNTNPVWGDWTHFAVSPDLGHWASSASLSTAQWHSPSAGHTPKRPQPRLVALNQPSIQPLWGLQTGHGTEPGGQQGCSAWLQTRQRHHRGLSDPRWLCQQETALPFQAPAMLSYTQLGPPYPHTQNTYLQTR